MQPPILHWKVVLALLAIVGGGVSLGSALHSGSDSQHHINRVFFAVGLNATQPQGGWTGYTPLRSRTPAAMQREACASFRLESRRGSKAERQLMRRFARRACAAHGAPN